MDQPDFIIEQDKENDTWRLITPEWFVIGFGKPPTVRRNLLGKLGVTVMPPLGEYKFGPSLCDKCGKPAPSGHTRCQECVEKGV